MANGPGPGVDAQGRAVSDPSENVKALNEATVQRLDDLRVAEARKHKSDLRHLEAMASLRAQHERELRDAEAKRIDAIRLVDVQAVQRAAEEQRVAASTLATQVAVSAETLRTQVASTASASRAEFINALEPMTKAIEELRRAQYETQGQKAQVVESRESAGDVAPLYAAIARLEAAAQRGEGGQAQVVERRGANAAVYAAVGFGITILFLLIGVATFVIANKGG